MEKVESLRPAGGSLRTTPSRRRQVGSSSNAGAIHPILIQKKLNYWVVNRDVSQSGRPWTRMGLSPNINPLTRPIRSLEPTNDTHLVLKGPNQ